MEDLCAFQKICESLVYTMLLIYIHQIIFTGLKLNKVAIVFHLIFCVIKILCIYTLA